MIERRPYLLSPEANWRHAADDEANLAWLRVLSADPVYFEGEGLAQ